MVERVLPPHPVDPDSDSVSVSRQKIEDRLVEEYRNCSYYKQTKAELGTFTSVSNKQLHCLMLD